MHLKSDKELKTNSKKPEFELLAPANNKNVAIQAIKAGADAVYMGYSKYGARLQAGNSFEDIIETVEFAHAYRAKVYITINTILTDEELANAVKLIWKLYNIKVDGVIIQDMGLLECDLPPIRLNASTQCHNNSLEKIKFLEKTGFSRVILPREITLREIREIKDNTDIQLECFVHGALCVSYSGQCYMSAAIGGRSANRGECAQPCRKKYSLKDADGKILVKDKYILSLKDFNLSNRLEDLILAGITSFKIEGRLKSEEYVVNVTAYYRKLLDNILENHNLKRASQGVSEYDFEPDLYKTFNRGYCEYYINGEKKDLATFNYNSSLGEYIGVVKDVKKNYFSLSSNVLNNGDGICFFNDRHELCGTNINKTENNLVFPADIKGIKQGTKIYRNYNKSFDDILAHQNLSRKIPLSLRMRETDFGYIFFLEDEEKNCACHIEPKKYENALNKEKALQTLKIQLAKSGNTIFSIKDFDIKLKNIPFIKVSKINEIRRLLTDKMLKIRKVNYKYCKRSQPIKVLEYPIEKLNYKANIYNNKAENFYKRRGCIVEERAFELRKNKTDAEVMVSKYCIKNQLGLCPKQKPCKKYKEPFALIDEFNKEYLVEFDCKECVMMIRV